MTLGQKLKEARTKAGLSQEQMAEKLCVSRQAVTKWENDRGIPDVENLKEISRLLSVSLDYLLNDGETLIKSSISEAIDLANYKGSRKNKKQLIVRERFPKATIYPLIAKAKLTAKEKFFDNAIGILTDAPFGTATVYNDIKNADKQYFLVLQDGRQYLVLITDELLTTRELAQPVDKKFEIDKIKFTRCSYTVK